MGLYSADNIGDLLDCSSAAEAAAAAAIVATNNGPNEWL